MIQVPVVVLGLLVAALLVRAGLYALVTGNPATDSGSAAATASVRIHLVVSGGYSYEGTLTHTEDARDGCSAGAVLRHGVKEHVYGAMYNGLEMLAPFRGSQIVHDSFAVTIMGYNKPGVPYSSTPHSDINAIVTLDKHLFLGDTRSDAPLVKIAADGLSGTITATHLMHFTRYSGFFSKPDGASVDLSATWTCRTLTG